MKDHPSLTPERWRRLQDVFAAALDMPPQNRTALLHRECGADAELRAEVVSLLEAHGKAGALDRLATDVVRPVAAQVHAGAADWTGRSVSRYMVLEPIGAGSMGVVYRARDERLNRSVALKFLPPHLVTDEGATRRFLLEARAAAALEHPNICTVHEIGETPDGQLFIAMPLYEGETLQARLARGPLPVAHAVRIACQMAAGLRAAHQRGIVHRDVKPSNVMLLPDGRATILDFGVAVLEHIPATRPEMVAGTAAYMSPEQLRGGAIDQRTDVWALGIVLYEMLAAERPFQGDDVAALTWAIPTSEPRPIGQRRGDVPPAVDDLIATALAKSPDARYPSMAALGGALAALELDGWIIPPAVGPPHPSGDPADTAPPAPVERRRAAVLAVSISSYASLVEHLEPEEVGEIIVRVRAAAVDVMRRYGGVVNQALGEEMVALFGVPAAHEDAELRAVRAALELHSLTRAIETAATRRERLALAVQSGIHAGQVVVQRLREGPRRFAVSGAPARMAAHLGWLAGPDQILVTPECQRVVSSFVETEPAPPVALSPGPAPVTPYRVVGDSGRRSRVDAADPARLTPYTGREAALATLETHVRQAAAGEGRVLVVVGDAGIGKSRLLYELCERVRTAQMRVLGGWCPSYGGVEPYRPFVDVLRKLLALDQPGARQGAGAVVERIRAIDASLDPFLPLYLHLLSIGSDAHVVPGHLQGEDLKAALLEALSAILIRQARHTPLLLMLEDWHWADNGSREALHRLAGMVDAYRLAIVVTSRSDPGLSASLRGPAIVVQLGPLDRASTSAMMRAISGAERASDALVHHVLERTGGNPFFIEQVMETLLEERAVTVRSGEAVVITAIEMLHLPDTVQAVIRARLDRLDGDARDLLRVASVIGREFGRDLLVAIRGAAVGLDRVLERLRAAGLVQPIRLVAEPAYRFMHVLTHEVAYDSLLEHQRKALHGIVGAAMARDTGERVSDRSELLAHHFSRAEQWSEAARYGRLAAGRLRGLGQFADALAMLDRVQQWLEHLPDDDGRRALCVDVLLDQERLCETLGQRGRQQRIIDDLIGLLARHGPSARLAEAYLRQGDLLILLKRFDAADRTLATVLRLSRERGDAVMERNALRSFGLLRRYQGRHYDAVALAETALEIDRALQDDLAIAGDLANMGSALRALGAYDRAQLALEAALEVPALAQNPVKMSYVLHHLAHVHQSAGDLERALACMERANENARVNLLPIQHAFHLTTIAHIYLQQGRLDDALRTYRESAEVSRNARLADGLAQSLRMLGELQVGLGQNEEALAHLREAAGLFAELGDREAEAQARAGMAGVLERLAAWEPALEAWRAVRTLAQAGDDPRGELAALEGLARAARRLGRPEDAASHLQQALALAAARGARRREVALHNTLGIVAWERRQYETALSHYETALHICREEKDHEGEGLMLNSIGVTLSRLHRYEEARTALEEGVELNHRSGERLLEGHALAALGDVARCLGRHEAARECFERSLVLRREIGDAQGESAMIQRLEALRAETPRQRL